tara:strand:- start:337 stop:459 length:123 start_codon:yes stop_codon:yes gene_type:complete
MKSEGRFIELDAIRGIAVIIVVIYHYTYKYLKLYPLEFDT